VPRVREGLVGAGDVPAVRHGTDTVREDRLGELPLGEDVVLLDGDVPPTDRVDFSVIVVDLAELSLAIVAVTEASNRDPPRVGSVVHHDGHGIGVVLRPDDRRPHVLQFGSGEFDAHLSETFIRHETEREAVRLISDVALKGDVVALAEAVRTSHEENDRQDTHKAPLWRVNNLLTRSKTTTKYSIKSLFCQYNCYCD